MSSDEQVTYTPFADDDPSPFDPSPLVSFLQEYSFDDLARAFFALSLWLPNISSPIKLLYLYALLESVAPLLPSENRLNMYADIEDFCETIFKLLPSFPMLEDYVPDADWGEIQ